MNVKNIILIALASIVTIAQAQEKTVLTKKEKKAARQEKINKLIKQEEEGALIFNKQSVFAAKITTDGYGGFYEKAKFKTGSLANMWWIDIAEHKHPKEERFATGDPTFGFIIGNPYVYAKINNFYNFKIGYGQQRLIGGKGNRNGVATTLNYGGGLAIAMMKPYFLDVSDPSNNETKTIRYKNNEALFLDQNRIIGAAGFMKGLGLINYIPGLHARTALRFDYGRYNEGVSAIEAGINVEYYTKNIEQLATIEGKKLFFTAYVALVFGRRK